MYVCGADNQKIYQFSLSTDWDISSAVYDDEFLYVGEAEETLPLGIFFRPDGMRIYVIGDSNNRIYQYSLTEKWEVSTATYDEISFDLSDQEIVPDSVFFRPDGRQMYIVGYDSDKIYQYSLPIAWDLSVVVYDHKFRDVYDQDNSPEGLFFKPDRTKIYLVGNENDEIYQYSTGL
jgi:sugar lactone lactonase YvrE